MNNTNSGSLFNIPHADKIAHFSLYALLSFFILLESRSYKKKLLYYFIPVIGSLILGGLIEMLQIGIENRSGDMIDLLADVIGSISAIPLFILIEKNRKKSIPK